jgi:hypothetical protein
VSSDWYIPEIELYVEYWGIGDGWQLPAKHKFYEENALTSIDVHEDELHVLDDIMPRRIKMAAPRCKLRAVRRR